MLLIGEKYPWIKDEVEAVRAVFTNACDPGSLEIQNEILNMMKQEDDMVCAVFVILASRFGTYNSDKVIHLAAVIEMLYIASKLQVDGFVCHNGARSKGKLLEKCFAGNYLYAESMILMSEKLNPDEVNKIVRSFKQLIMGEYGQLSQRYVLHTSKRTYLKHIEARSSAIFEMCFQLGAIQSKSSRTIVHTLKRIGYHIGMANQLIDDLVDIDENEKLCGKTLGVNIREGVYPLSMHYLFKALPEETMRLLGKKPIRERHIMRLIELMHEHGAVEKTRLLAQMYTRKVYSEINLLPTSDYRQVIFDLASHLLERRY